MSRSNVAVVVGVNLLLSGCLCPSNGVTPDGGAAANDGGGIDASTADAGSADAGPGQDAGLADGGACDANFSTDPNNCGACGVVCCIATACLGGLCVMDCPAGMTICPSGLDAGCLPNAICTNPSTDPSNCGSCGNRCGAGVACIGGTCSAGDGGAVDSGPACPATAGAFQTCCADAPCTNGLPCMQTNTWCEPVCIACYGGPGGTSCDGGCGGANQPCCTGFNAIPVCNVGLFCSGTNCVTPNPDGGYPGCAGCTQTSECTNGFVCADGGACVLPADYRIFCQNAQQCPNGQTCVTPPAGYCGCSTGDVCPSGWTCDPNVEIPSCCAPSGAICITDNDCCLSLTPLHCVGGVCH